MKEPSKLKKYSVLISSSIFSLVLANLGGNIIKTDLWLGLSWILISFLIVYFSSYFSQIKTNEETLIELSKKIEKIEDEIQIKESLLNTLKDIVILKDENK